MLRRQFTGLALSLPFSLMLGGAAKAADEVVIYSSNPTASIDVLRAELAEQAGLSSEFVRAGSAVLMRQIKADMDAPHADIMWSSSVSTLAAFAALLQPYDAPALASIPEHWHYPDNLLLPSNIHVTTIMVNSGRLQGSAIPTAWQTLAAPEWKGRVVVPDPVNSSTGYVVLYGLSQLLDRKTYQQLVSNLVVMPTSPSVHRAVAAGEYAVGITFETNAYAYIQQGQDDLSMIYPSDGALLTPDYVAVIRQADQGTKALKVIDVLLSRQAQIALLQSGYRRPSRSDIKVSEYVNLPDLNDIQVFEIDEFQAAAERHQFLAYWDLLPKAAVLD